MASPPLNPPITLAANANKDLLIPPLVAKLPIKMKSGITDKSYPANRAKVWALTKFAKGNQPACEVYPIAPAKNMLIAMGNRTAIKNSMLPKMTAVSSRGVMLFSPRQDEIQKAIGKSQSQHSKRKEEPLRRTQSTQGNQATWFGNLL